MRKLFTLGRGHARANFVQDVGQTTCRQAKNAPERGSGADAYWQGAVAPSLTRSLANVGGDFWRRRARYGVMARAIAAPIGEHNRWARRAGIAS